MPKITVDLGEKSYDIEIASGLWKQMGQTIRQLSAADKAAVITDTTVDKLYGPELEEQLKAAGFITRRIIFPAGENHKTISTLSAVYSKMADFGLTRKDLVVTLGGGVVGDLGGFAAATFLRGIDFIQVPTTLLAQIDSSVGGKVAVDLPEGKNLVGNFYQPKGVLIDPELLKSLPARYLHDGLAEVIKCGAFGDATMFGHLETYKNTDEVLQNVNYIIATCCRLKAKVVAEDERDVGARMVLNFGHTIGHAVEKYFNYEKYTHGEAVAIGMVRMTKQTEALGLTVKGTAQRLEKLLQHYALPTDVEIPTQSIIAVVAMDKKKRGNSLTIVTIPAIGKSKLIKIPFGDLVKYVG